MPPSIEKSKQGNKNNGAMKDKSTLTKRPKGRPRKKPIEDNEAIATQSKRPRGRPRKNPIENSLDNLDCNDQYVQGLAVQLSENSSEAHAVVKIKNVSSKQQHLYVIQNLEVICRAED